jgi:hypothetical protein
MKTIAILQPYFFPYIGYWQLIKAVDRFVILDDVNYIMRGWVNRNRLLINSEPTYITAPLHQATQNKKICEIDLQSPPNWRDKLVKMVEITYRKAPHFSEVFPVVERLIRHETNSLSDYLAHQLQTLSLFMGINTEFVESSRCYGNNDLSGQGRILDICKREDAAVYINPQGGQEIYDWESFNNAGVELRFIIMRPIPYKQRAAGFIPYLSIIDALMEIGPMEIKQHLDAYDLRKGESE